MTAEDFPPVPSGYPFPALEAEVLAEWRDQRVFERSLERPSPHGEWVLYEGPPTANNKPHVGHVVTRAVKDLYPRYRTMRGFKAPRKAGWDTHGLPVEIEVEKALGFSGKEEIERYGIAEFNARCLESVHTYEAQWRVMTERVGYWTDLDDAYFTYTNEYVESVWWSLKTLWEKGLLVEGYKIQPYCARCGTTLSSHEVAQNYKEADDPSVWVRFPVNPGQTVKTAAGEDYELPEGLAFVAWTTTPWTLLSHVALAVHPELTYKVVADPVQQGKKLLVAEGLETEVPVLLQADGERKLVDLREAEAEATVRGEALAGLRYVRPFATPPEFYYGQEPEGASEDFLANGGHVVTGEYVTLSDGTGIVHTAPAFGEDDYQTFVKSERLPFIRAIDDRGTVRALEGIDERLHGLWFKTADPEIQRDLKERGLLLHAAQYRHNYPFCWRCDRPLLYYAWDSWFVATTREKDELIAENRTIGWHPAHVGEGRFGKWLENVVDWALSRNRYWGTPLPVWTCSEGDCSHVEVIGSYEELFERADRQLPENPYDRDQFDPHRPFVDRSPPQGTEPFSWPCPQEGCSGTMGRVEEVIDAWYDSGAMPFAQYHYPFSDPELTRRRFPADLICEAVDQTRGWFYTLHVLGTLLFDSRAYDHCIVLGHVNDEEGRKMSKRLGNVVDPMAVIEETGADALRWYFYVSNPTASSRFSARLVREAAQGFLLPLWNALSFFTIYANLDGWRPGETNPTLDFATRPALDRWVLLRLDRLVGDVSAALDDYRTTDAARAVESFVEELTNWYIRRSRNRFWAATETAPPDVASGLAPDGSSEPRGQRPAGTRPAATSGEESRDKESAYQALYEVLTTLARLLAPFTPFVADVLHRHLERSQGRGADSVHLEDWPAADRERSEPELEAAMAAIQRIVSLGRAARNTHSIKTRQPLAAVTLVSADEALPGRVEPYEELLRDELNVHAVRWAADRGTYVHHEVKPVYPKTGPRFGKQMKEVAAALAAADGDALAAELEERGAVSIEISSGAEELAAEEVEVRLVEKEGTATQGDRELLVALETELTPELVAEGRAREVVHLVQAARKEMDLDYADRVRLAYAADGELAEAVAAHAGWIGSETLAVEVAAAAPGDLPNGAREAEIDGLRFAYAVERVSS